MSYYKDSYSVNEIFLDFLGRKYIVKVGGTTPSIPFDSEIKENDTIMWGDLRLVEYHEGGGGGGSEYSQITRLGATQNTNLDIAISETLDFNRPPLEVLKFQEGTTDIITTLNTFDSSDSNKFIYDEDSVEFNGYMKLITEHVTPMSSPTACNNGYISESDYITLNKFDDYIYVGVI